MAKYTPRLTAPSANDKYFIHYSKGGYNTCIKIDNSTGSVLPNCVGYAQGRLLELLGKKAVNWKLPACNAEDWLDAAKKAGFKTGQTPKLGAIAVYRAGQTHNSADGCGHVAVVEQIKANGDIVLSNSAYGGARFYLKNVTKASGYAYASNRPLIGFIYCGIEYESDTSSSSPTKTIKAGEAFTLKDAPIYTSATGGSVGKRSGIYRTWDDTVVNGRIRMTNSASRVGVKGQVSFWVDVSNLK